MNKLIAQIAAGTIGIWIATEIVPRVSLAPTAPRKKLLYLIIIGTVIGLINFFIKPLLDLITLPLRILSLGIFSFILDMGIIWAADIIFVEVLTILGFVPLIWTTLIVLILSTILPKIRLSH